MPNLGPIELMIWLAIWIPLMLPLGLVSILIAWRKGRRSIWWTVYSILVPFVSIFHALWIAKDYQALEKRKLQSEYHVKCPRCAEIIKAEAQICRFCQYELSPHA